METCSPVEAITSSSRGLASGLSSLASAEQAVGLAGHGRGHDDELVAFLRRSARRGARPRGCARGCPWRCRRTSGRSGTRGENRRKSRYSIRRRSGESPITADMDPPDRLHWRPRTARMTRLPRPQLVALTASPARSQRRCSPGSWPGARREREAAAEFANQAELAVGPARAARAALRGRALRPRGARPPRRPAWRAPSSALRIGARPRPALPRREGASS